MMPMRIARIRRDMGASERRLQRVCDLKKVNSMLGDVAHSSR